MKKRASAVLSCMLLVAVPLEAHAKMPCMDDNELSSYMLWMGVSSGHVQAEVCARRFPVFQTHLRDILAERKLLKPHANKVVGAYERAFPNRGKQTFAKFAKRILVNEHQGKSTSKNACALWFGRMRLLKRRAGDYTAAFRSLVEPVFDAERRRVPRCGHQEAGLLPPFR